MYMPEIRIHICMILAVRLENQIYLDLTCQEVIYFINEEILKYMRKLFWWGVG